MQSVSSIPDDAWQRFVQEAAPPFFVMPEWASFQESVGHDVLRFGIMDGEQLVAVALCARFPMRFGLSQIGSTFSPWVHPSLLKEAERLQNVFALWIEEVRRWRVSSDALVRVLLGIAEETGSAAREALLSLGARPASRAPSPEHTHVVDLAPTVDALLANMHQKTRYNIRRAEKKDVSVRFSTQETLSQDFEAFLELHNETISRQGFTGHPVSYYEQLLASSNTDWVQLVFAEYDGQPLASAILVTTPIATTYVHGASTHKERTRMAPHALHWAAIQFAKERGCATYDFWGVAPPGASDDHPLAGVSRFKRGFGGRDVAYLPTMDLPLRPMVYRGLRLFGK